MCLSMVYHRQEGRWRRGELLLFVEEMLGDVTQVT
jgi:hypothetical protein